MKYSKDFFTALKSIDWQKVFLATKKIKLASQVFVGGNGGSAAIASHLVCDIQKGCYPVATIPIINLSSNIPLLTALANDLGYENTFYAQLQAHLKHTSDVAIFISSSGNSPNIVKAAEFAKEQGITIIGMTGFTGGKLKELSNIPIHIKSNDYGHIEDCHSHIMHTIAHTIKNRELDARRK